MGKAVKSRVQRREEFITRAAAMYDALEEWYDGHPEASFGEIEHKAREQRRELMGETLGILINTRQHKSACTHGTGLNGGIYHSIEQSFIG